MCVDSLGRSPRIYIVGGWVYSIGYVWSHWAGFWHFGSLAFYASIQAIFWPIIIGPLSCEVPPNGLLRNWES